MLNEKSNKGNFVDKAKVFGAVLTNLLKAFNCLSHELMIGRLSAHRSSLNSLTLFNAEHLTLQPSITLEVLTWPDTIHRKTPALESLPTQVFSVNFPKFLRTPFL